MVFEEIKKNFSSQRIRLGNYVAIGLLTGLLLSLSFFFIPPSSVDPRPLRLVMGVVFPAAVLLGWLFPQVRKHAYSIGFVLLCFLSLWALFMNMANDFEIKHLSWFSVIFLSVNLFLKRFWPVVFYMGLIIVSSLLMYPLLNEPKILPVLFYMMELVLGISVFIALSTLTREFQGLEQKGDRYQWITEMSFQHSKDAILVTDEKGVVVEYNALFQSLWGLEEQSLYGWKLPQLHQASANLVSAGSHQPFQDARDWSEDVWDNPLMFLRDGTVIQRHSAQVEAVAGGLWEVWYFRDITVNWRSREALYSSEQHNRAIVEALPDIVLHLADDNSILELKVPNLPEYEGLILSESASSPKALLGGELAEEIEGPLEACRRGQAVAVFETQIDWGGRLRDLEIRVVRSGSNAVLVLIRDVSQRKEMERELIQRNFELDSFVYRASHDLKAPLNSMMGLLGLLKADEKGEDRELYLRMMDKSVYKLDTFIRNLTEFSRVSRTQSDQVEVDLRAMVNEIMESVQHMDNFDRVKVQIDLAAGNNLVTDPFLLEIVLANLISNAIKYQNLERDDSSLQIVLVTSDTHHQVWVKDNGIGIPEAYQSRLFELFFRASNQSFGSGLGLYIARNAVDKMGGEILFESLEGEGTSFCIRIPVGAVGLAAG